MMLYIQLRRLARSVDSRFESESTFSRHLLVHLQSLPCRFQPIECVGSFDAKFPQFIASSGIGKKTSDGVSNIFMVERIDQYSSVAHHLGQTSPVSDYHRSATLHRFDHRQTESLKVRWIDETKSA